MTADNLRSELAALPGVAAAQVTIRPDERPIVRVWLDGTKDGSQVRELIDALLGRALPSPPATAAQSSRRRSGLGRGLGDLLPDDDNAHPVPTHFQPDAEQRPTIARVAVVETWDRVAVEVEDSKGRCATAPVRGEGSIDGAVVDAIRQLLGVEKTIDVNIEGVDTANGAVILATAGRDEKRAAGAAFVEFGRPSAVARAAFQTLRDL